MSKAKQLLDLVEQDSPLPKPNAFFTVTKPFKLYVRMRMKPSNSSYGSSRIYEPEYKQIETMVGDQIHHLHGGTFYIPMDTDSPVPYHCRISTPDDSSPFEKKPMSGPDSWPMDSLKAIKDKQSADVDYALANKEVKK